MSESILTLTIGLAIMVAVVSLVGFIPLSGWLIDLISHFRVQYASLLCLGSLVAVLAGEFLLAVLLAVAGAVNLWPVVPFLPLRRADRAEGFLRLVLINVRMRNRNFRSATAFLAEQDPEIIALVEVDQGWLDALGEDLMAGEYHTTSVPRQDSYGLVIYSKLRIVASEPIEFPALDTPSLACEVVQSGSTVHLLLVHLPPPLSPMLMRRRDEGLLQVADWLADREGNWLVMGDFNLSPWSPQIKRFCEVTGFHSVREGRGILATWPDHFAPLRIPLDHVFGSPQIEFGRPRLGTSIKSDHLPVVVRFRIRKYLASVN